MSDIRFNRWLHQSGTGGVSQDSSGNIGIGTTVPTKALDVRGDVNIGNTININNASGIISATTFTGTTGTFSGNVSAVDATFTGNVTIGGTLTYEDVANIDAVGIITAQSDIIVGGGLTVTGISTFNNDIKLLDNDKLKFGIGEDLQIYHDGSASYIHDQGVGDLNICVGQAGSKFVIQSGTSGGHLAEFNYNGAAELFYSGNQKLETTNTGAVVTGILTATSSITGPNYEIANISSSISDTAVDVFVYDTRKDSDGGAWRKRTQHTSWYNETLGTAIRGTRREFPAVAVLVLEAGKLTIYDGDDPDLPMWMVFNNTGSNVSIFGRSLSTKTSVEMLNGLLVIGGSYSSAHFEAFTHINFISEKCQQTNNTGTIVFYKNISQRGETSTYSSDTSSFTLVNIVSVNDVAMTVLPNAPIDDATGLPIPTIAVATNEGVSIIKDDGTVVDITSPSTNDAVGNIALDDEYVYFTSPDSGAATEDRMFFVYKIPSSDINNTFGYNDSDAYLFTTFTPSTTTPSNPSLAIGNSIEDIANIVVYDKKIFSALPSGLAYLDKYSTTTAGGSVAYITSDYNTGWMHGDIKGAFLSDTDTTNITGSEKLANYDFAADFSTQWEVANNANTSYDATNDRVTVTSTQNYSGIQLKSASLPTLTAGKRYIMTVDIHSITNPIYFGVVSGLTVSDVNSAGVWTGVFTASNVTEVFIKKPTGSNSTFVLNSVSIREAEEDRSVNNKGLQVFGTITKQPVATGAELVSYSGWSSSNYLIQPYNSDLDFGTGNWCYMFWYNPEDAESGDVIFSRWSYNVDSQQGPRVTAYFNSGDLRVDTADASAGNGYQGHKGDDNTQDSNEWHCAVILRRGSNLEIWIDGVNYKNAALNSTSDGSYTDTNSILEIGHSPNSGTPEVGLELALFRISATAPSPEQIKKMYEDEKVLFQENAKATLYGSSDAVTALGYDEDTGLLHVGTSSGRSDFQGLRRINNTTTAVTTAISASDDLIAEQ